VRDRETTTKVRQELEKLNPFNLTAQEQDPSTCKNPQQIENINLLEHHLAEAKP
jgi:hypothetical protein